MKIIKYVFAIMLLSSSFISCTDIDESLNESIELQSTTGEDMDDRGEPDED
ncbi:hypothetical protein [Polaribacter sp.]|uniref:hypothetical protein n=1 Tax=Polaribacter sp. TaxID=1920175 RepID=UPI003EF4561F